MRPYYDHAGITIYHGDCRDVLPGLEPVSCVITDPVWPNCPNGLLPGSDDPWGLFQSVAQALTDIAPLLVIILGTTSDPRFLSLLPRDFPFQCIRYLRYALPSFRGRLVYGGDMAYVFGQLPPPPDGRRLFPGEFTHVHRRNPWRNGTAHPAARQLSHMTSLVEWFAGDTVLDPFMGSGTTLVASKRLGRRAIGIEIDERYCELASTRLAQERLL